MLQPNTIPLFDSARAYLEDYVRPDVSPARLQIESMIPLDEALREGRIAPETLLLTFEMDEQFYGFPISLVVTRNVIQSAMPGKRPWMMTFCNACNTGMVFDPVLHGRELHFRRRGAYDGMLLVFDDETQTYWHHINGRGLYGQNQGAQLNIIAVTRQRTAGELAGLSKPSWLCTDTLLPGQERFAQAMETMRQQPDRMAQLADTMVTEDPRLPRFELGLGIWHGDHSLFAPLTTVHEYNNAVITTLGERQLLLYLTPDAVSPTAIFVDAEVTSARWEGATLRLNNGDAIKNDVYTTAGGIVRRGDSPEQLLMRWYGFAATYPTCRILLSTR